MVAYSESTGGYVVGLQDSWALKVPQSGCLKTWTLSYKCGHREKPKDPVTCRAKMKASASQISPSERRTEHLDFCHEDHKPPIRKKMSLVVNDKIAELALERSSVADCRHTVKKLYRGKL